MKTCEILSVGTELLLGDTVDTNATFLSRAMRQAGFAVHFHQTCGDNWERLEKTLNLALSRADLVLVTGGLGPTYDDITREVAASVMQMPLEEDAKIASGLQAYFLRRGMEMSWNNLRQAMVPRGALVLQNDWGTAPGLWLEKEGKIVVLLPGVPREMKALFIHRVMPLLKEQSPVSLYTLTLRFYGISESKIDEILSELMKTSENPTVAPYAGEGQVEIHITASAETENTAISLCRQKAEEVLALVGEYCYGEGEDSLEKVLVERLLQKGLQLSVMEEITGGMLSQRISSVFGSKKVLIQGLYSPHPEQNFPSFSKADLAECMAREALRYTSGHVGVGVTGVLEENEATKEDPVGTVYVAVIYGEKKEIARTVFGHLASERDHIRHLAASKALALILEICECYRHDL